MTVEKERLSEHAPFGRNVLRWFSWSPYLLLALAVLFWAGNHVVGRAVAGEAPPFGVSTVRWLVAAIVLWPLAWPHLNRDWPLIRHHWAVCLLLGLTGGAMMSALQYIALQYTTALNVSVLNSLGPVLIVAAGTIVFGDRIGAVQVLGIAISMTGVIAVVTRGRFEALLQLELNWGDVLAVVNM